MVAAQLNNRGGLTYCEELDLLASTDRADELHDEFLARADRLSDYTPTADVVACGPAIRDQAARETFEASDHHAAGRAAVTSGDAPDRVSAAESGTASHGGGRSLQPAGGRRG